MALVLARSLGPLSRVPTRAPLPKPNTRSFCVTKSVLIAPSLIAHAKKPSPASSRPTPHQKSVKGANTAAPTSVSAPAAAKATAAKSSVTPSAPRPSKSGVARTAAASASSGKSTSKGKVSTQSTKAGGAGSLRSEGEEVDLLRKQLKWRSKQRGMKETILLLGTFAMEHVDTMPAKQLAQYRQILEEADPDIYNWLSGSVPVPPQLDGAVWKKLKKHARLSRVMQGTLDTHVKSLS